MEKPKRIQQYASFLLRVWCEIENGTAQWRASLEDPKTGEKVGFATLDLLFDHLRRSCDKSKQSRPEKEMSVSIGEPHVDECDESEN